MGRERREKTCKGGKKKWSERGRLHRSFSAGGTHQRREKLVLKTDGGEAINSEEGGHPRR